jgi:hypothetical protein
MARVGIIQTRGIGDIVIALPIAAWFARGGHSVFWPVDERWQAFLQEAAPYVTFLPVPQVADAASYLVTLPQAALEQSGVDETFMLYSALSNVGGIKVQNERYPEFMQFDQYKYALTHVPFSEKWNLEIVRNRRREEELFDSLGIGRDFVCVHPRSANFAPDVTIPPEWESTHDVVEIDERSASPFDWILTMERASKLVFIDSCFANLAEQLNLPMEKYLILRSPGPATPVFKNGWIYL